MQAESKRIVALTLKPDLDNANVGNQLYMNDNVKAIYPFVVYRFFGFFEGFGCL
jgi:hypothetical protein